MAGLIPKEFINDVIEKSNIVELISARVEVKKAGSSYKACCPFHNEKSPSFHISSQKQVYHCFGCGASGNVITFIMEYDRVDFPEAIEELAHHLGLEVPREQASAQNFKQEKPLYELLAKASTFYQKQLKTHPEATKAIEYMQKRGLTGDIAERYLLGYSPSGWHQVNGLASGKYANQLLLDSGLQIKNERGNQYDRFRERLMFPIRDRRGRFIGFGGRVIGNDEPKYLNSPETPVFHKGRELYGFYEAMQFDRQLDSVIVVEGYMDVIALAQFHVNNAVATLGTATSEEHIKQLFKVVKTITFCFDGDKAGRQAAWKAMESALPELKQGKLIRFAFLPQGEDPDTYIRQHGTEAFSLFINQQSAALSDFLFDQLELQIPLTALEQKAQYVSEAKKYIALIKEPVLVEVLLSELQSRVKMELQNTQQPASSQTKANANKKGMQMTPMRKLIALIIQQPQLVHEKPILARIQHWNLPGVDLLIALAEFIERQSTCNTALIIEAWRGSQYESALQKLAYWQPEIEEDKLVDEYEDYIKYLSKQANVEQLESLKSLSKKRPLTNEEKQQLQQLMQNKH
jgi:DNA primase